MAHQVASLEAICRHQGVGSALLQPDLVLSMIQRMALALDRAAQWDSDEGLGLALASHLVGKAKPLPCPEKRQLVATAITLHSLQLKEGQEVRQQYHSSSTHRLSQVATKNPLRMHSALRSSNRPATLFRLLS